MLGRSSGCTLQLHVENEGHRAVIDEGDLYTRAEYARLNRHPQITERLAEALGTAARPPSACAEAVDLSLADWIAVTLDRAAKVIRRASL